MQIGDHVHWFVTGDCNLDCPYCFRVDNPYIGSKEIGTYLAKALVENGIKKTTIGGGEPLLVGYLDDVLEILKKGGIHVSIDTNGTSLNEKRIAQLSEYVDCIALPVDSNNRQTQMELRGDGFAPVFDRLPELAESITKNGIKLGYHTVFTANNYRDIPGIYSLIRQNDFDFWRVREFNFNLAFDRFMKKYAEREATPEILARFEKLKSLMGSGTSERGYSDCLLAHFFLTEENMRQYNDERIQFVGVRDTPTPYAFLDNSGDISFYTWSSGRKRRVLGNMIKDDFSVIRKRLKEVHESRWDFDEQTEDELITAMNDKPIWARLFDGNFFIEEIEEISPEHHKTVAHLRDLYNVREARSP